MVIGMMRVGLYARVSTTDKQDPDTQRLPLREFCQAQGWTIAGEFMDSAPATDYRARTAWRALLDQAARRRVALVLVWRIDRAFRSVLDAATTLERLRGWGVGLRSYTEPWIDTTSPFGEALYYITAAYAQLERGILAERVRAGMDRARRQGRHIGRPGGTRAEGFADRWRALAPRIHAGEVSRRQAARTSMCRGRRSIACWPLPAGSPKRGGAETEERERPSATRLGCWCTAQQPCHA
jgi:DNA invertase Pin-like site-specific DNA recombinase